METTNVKTTPNIMIASTANVDAMEEKIPVKKLPIKMVAIVIKKGNLPLHGIKLLVKIPISFSLGESIILHPTTPAALQPNPMHMVSACFPELHALLKYLSKLKAILGSTPKSSNNVNKGKKIAMGGSITAIIHVTVL